MAGACTSGRASSRIAEATLGPDDARGGRTRGPELHVPLSRHEGIPPRLDGDANTCSNTELARTWRTSTALCSLSPRSSFATRPLAARVVVVVYWRPTMRTARWLATMCLAGIAMPGRAAPPNDPSIEWDAP